ncbi:glucoamylase family protein [Xylanimonas sp. McL0601]|uniref:glucoamylase family protein n=1 Tax=Xylanimonas sp. McL0601 TaxID=3414739 RepID=UPI003CEE3C72
MRHARLVTRALACVAVAALAVGLGPGLTANAAAPSSATQQPLTAAQRSVLRGIAKDTWAFYAKDVDPSTALPLDNVGPGTTRGTYTSASNVGVYLWAVVSAHDLGLISTGEAVSRLQHTLKSVQSLQRSDGFLYQWYDTTTGQVILNPGQGACPKVGGTTDNCSFLSAVDNGWYASGLVVARQALPQLSGIASALLGQMDFSIFYDNRAQTACNVNADLQFQPTGQQYGGYYAGVGPAGYHNGAIYSDPRISMYIGMGLHQMPGDVWWRSWRTLPPKLCDTDPDFSWQGQWPPQGYWTTITDPQSGKVFPVWEGHYTYPGSDLTFVPTYAGGMFEGLMANEVVPETTWGPQSFGLADQRIAQVQIKYATEELGYPVWGMSPSSTADDTGGYGGFGADGFKFPQGQWLAQGPCFGCQPDPESVVTPHASFLALDVAPQQAFANIMKLRQLYPDLYTHDGGFYDAVNPATGQVGHRMLVLDQSMIMAALDNALNGGRLQHWFAQDPVSNVAKLYLGVEKMSL